MTKIKKLWDMMKTFVLITIIISIGASSVISYNTYMDIKGKLAPKEVYLIEPSIPVLPEEVKTPQEDTQSTTEGYEEYNTITMEVSAYTARVEETDGDPRTMASGKEVYVGAVACPRNWKFDTRIEIDGTMYTCEDRMNIRYTNNVDIFMEDLDSALAFGRQEKEVIVYKKV